LSPTGGKRLVVTEHFGSVLADVLVKPDGRVYVMGHNPRFPAKWARRYLAADLECLCGGMPTIGCPLRAVDSNHYVIERGWYVLDLRTVETKPGPQPAQLFDETKASQGELKKAQKRL
jgi:hypothetical protein